MALRPDLVGLSRLPQDEEAHLVGISGQDPRQASVEFGQRAVDAIVERMVAKGEEPLGAYG